MTTTIDISLFDDKGLVRTDLSEAELAQMDDISQEVAAETIIACQAAQKQDLLVSELRQQLYKSVELENVAVEEDMRVNVAVDPTDAARAVIAANNPNLPRVKPRKINAKVRSEREAASLATITIRQTFNEQLKRQREVTNPARAAQIIRWMRLQAPPEGRALAEVREFQQRGNNERAANMADHGTPEPAKPVVHHLTEMERAGPLAKVRQRRPDPGSLKAVPPLGHRY
jgi:hypothetical protein